jgi:hypothetical protein
LVLAGVKISLVTERFGPYVGTQRITVGLRFLEGLVIPGY